MKLITTLIFILLSFSLFAQHKIKGIIKADNGLEDRVAVIEIYDEVV